MGGRSWHWSLLVVIGWAVLGACGADVPQDPAQDDPMAPAVSSPASDDAPAQRAPNFDFEIGETYRTLRTTTPSSIAFIERFFEGALAPLQSVPDLLPEPVAVVYDTCGSALSEYDPEARTILLCHEMAERAYGLLAASQDTDEDEEQNVRWSYAAMAFVLYYEVGHALYEQRDLPLAGSIESGIDSIATVIAVETGRGLDAVFGAGLFEVDVEPFGGQRPDGTDRAGDIACWAFGGDARLRSTLAALPIDDIWELSGRDCVGEYAGQRDAVRGWLPGLARLASVDALPNGDDRSSSFTIELGESWMARNEQDTGTVSRVSSLLSNALDVVEAALGAPLDPIRVTYDLCGEATSSYDVATRTIRLCDEFVASAYSFISSVGESDAGAAAYSLELAYETIVFALYHEVGHALRADGRMPATEPPESAADALATVLMVESGRGLYAYYTTIYFYAAPDDFVRLHDVDADRQRDLLCWVLGGDAGLRLTAPEDLLDSFITGDRDCIAEYRERRDAVRGWLAGPS